MSILDDAIREHLELKRAHGADDAEVKRLEDEAFGPPQRPDEIDPFAEAPTEFLASPGEAAAGVPEVGDEDERSGRRPNLTDLQEPPPAEDAAGWPPADAPEAPAEAAEVPLPPPGGAPAADLAPPPGEAPAPPVEGDAAASFFDQELVLPADEAPAAEPPADEAPPPTDEAPAPPAAEEQPAEEHLAEEPDPAGRQAIAEQPTQMFDVQAHVEAEAAAEAPPTGEQRSSTDEELVDAAQEEPRAAPVAPGDAEPEEGSAEFDFFNEQRLSDELDQALEAPLPPTDEHLAMPQYKDELAEGGDSVFDFESEAEERHYEDDPSQEVLRRADAAEAAEEPPSDEPPRQSAEETSADQDEADFDPDPGQEDVLEGTPRFLEDAPEDDDLWFEQKPPKDFDLD